MLNVRLIGIGVFEVLDGSGAGLIVNRANLGRIANFLGGERLVMVQGVGPYCAGCGHFVHRCPSCGDLACKCPLPWINKLKTKYRRIVPTQHYDRNLESYKGNPFERLKEDEYVQDVL